MEKMEGKTESLEMVNENNGRLLTELDSLVNKLQISYDHQVSFRIFHLSIIKQECVSIYSTVNLMVLFWG
jgi:hypothetical protein